MISRGLTPRQLFNVYAANCPYVHTVIEVDPDGVGLEMFHVGRADIASAEFAVQ